MKNGLIICLLIKGLGIGIIFSQPQFHHYQPVIWGEYFKKTELVTESNLLIKILGPLRVCSIMINAAPPLSISVNLVVGDITEFLHNPTQHRSLNYSPSFVLSNSFIFSRAQGHRKLGQNCFLFLHIPHPILIQHQILDEDEYTGQRYHGEYVNRVEDFFFILAVNRDTTLHIHPNDERAKPIHREIGERRPQFISRHPLNYLVITIQNSIHCPKQWAVQLQFKCGPLASCTKSLHHETVGGWTSHGNVISYFKNGRRDFGGALLQVGVWDLWRYDLNGNVQELNSMEVTQILALCGDSWNGRHIAPLKGVLHIVTHVNATPIGVTWGIGSWYNEYKPSLGIIQYRHLYQKFGFGNFSHFYDSYHWLIFYGENFELDLPTCFADLLQPIEISVAVSVLAAIIGLVIILRLQSEANKKRRPGPILMLLHLMSALLNQIGSMESLQFREKLILTLWLICSFFINSYYLGNVQSHQMAPGTRPALGKSLDDLITENYSLYAFHETHKEHVLNFNLHRMKESAVEHGWGDKIFEDYDRLLAHMNGDINSFGKEGYRQIYGADKSAVLLNTDELQLDEKMAARIFSKNFYKSNRNYFYQWISWTFDSPNVDMLVAPFKRLLTAGIVGYWWNWKMYFYTLWRFNEVKDQFQNDIEPKYWNEARPRVTQSRIPPLSRDPKASGMSEPLIKSSFYILSVCLFSGLMAFVGEVLRFYSSLVTNFRQNRVILLE